MIGVSFGAPTEFKSNGKIIEGDLPQWAPGNVSNAIDQDDLYVEMTFAEVMDRIGLDATTEQYGEAFRTSKYNLWHANAGARRLLETGIKAPWSGHPKYNVHANDIDFQIEADFIGLMTPGLPNAARDYSIRVGQVMNFGDGLYGGLFVTGMYAAAFFDTDVRRVVEAGLALMPAGSTYAAIIRDVLAWHREDPANWRRTWQRIQDKWDTEDSCPDGSLRPFNIDARLNGAYIALGLLYGNGDFARTLDVTTRAGQDSDCNPSNAVGILGVMLGYAKIPDEWKSGIPALAGRKFAYTNYSFDDIVASTLKRAEMVVRQAGGQVTADRLTIPPQAPFPPCWNSGTWESRIGSSKSTTPSWQWAGPWQTPPAGREGRPERGRMADGERRRGDVDLHGDCRDDHGPLRGRRRARGSDAGRQAGAGDQRLDSAAHDRQRACGTSTAWPRARTPCAWRRLDGRRAGDRARRSSCAAPSFTNRDRSRQLMRGRDGSRVGPGGSGWAGWAPLAGWQLAVARRPVRQTPRRPTKVTVLKAARLIDGQGGAPLANRGRRHRERPHRAASARDCRSPPGPR